MCRLFGMSAGRERVRASFWLLDAPDSLRAQSRRNPDGTGLGWYDERRRPRVRRQTAAAYEDPPFVREAQTVRSSTFVAHVRHASTGALTEANTHPFEQEGRLFAHNGVLEGLDELDRELGDARRLVRGDTDSERLFALITARIAAGGGDVGEGIAAAIGWVADHLPVFSLNFVLVEDERLWALRYPDAHGLWLLDRREPETGDDFHGRSARTPLRIHSDDVARCDAVVVASEPLDDDARWDQLEPGVLVAVDPELGIARRTIRDAPPAHPLTLADLEGAAARSQAG